MELSDLENGYTIDKAASETLALYSLIEKDCALYHQNTIHIVFDSKHNVVAANFLARKLIASLMSNAPKMLTQLAHDALKLRSNSEYITITDPSESICLEFISTSLDKGRYHYLTQKERLFDTKLTSQFLRSFDRIEKLVTTSNNLLWETDKMGKFSFVSGASNFGYEPSIISVSYTHLTLPTILLV